MQPYGRRATTMWLHGGGRAGTPESHCAPIDTPFQATTTPQQESTQGATHTHAPNRQACSQRRNETLKMGFYKNSTSK
jgi:hypothetical protein